MNEMSGHTESTQSAPANLRAASRRDELGTEHNKNDGYFNLLAYIVSNAIAGEVMAIENYSEMVPLMPDTESKIETVKQAHEESKHILMLASLGERHDYNVMREIVEPQWFMKTDIDGIRIEALDTYVETLDRANFDPAVTAVLIESMQTYGGTPSMHADLANA